MADVSRELDAETGVATVTLRRPPNNYFDRALVAELADVVLGLEEVPECRAIVLAAEGKHFCAGRDFSRPAAADDGPRELYQEALRLFEGSRPIVAACNGASIGGGLGLAMVADFRVAGPSTRFSANFSRLGYFPGFGLTETLSRVMGAQRALEVLYTGETIAGEQLVTSGLADAFAPDDDVLAGARAFARRIAAAAPLSVQAARRMLRGELAETVRRATERELEVQLRLRASADFREAQAARKDRREPQFVGA